MDEEGCGKLTQSDVDSKEFCKNENQLLGQTRGSIFVLYFLCH